MRLHEVAEFQQKEERRVFFTFPDARRNFYFCKGIILSRETDSAYVAGLPDFLREDWEVFFEEKMESCDFPSQEPPSTEAVMHPVMCLSCLSRGGAAIDSIAFIGPEGAECR